MRIVITGANGFVGPHLVHSLTRMFGADAEIVATSKVGGEHPVIGSVRSLDVCDPETTTAFLRNVKPTHVVHLAGIAAVTASNADPDTAWRVHLHGTLNLARAMLRDDPECWLLNAASGLMYGDSAKAGHPLTEDSLLAPTDEYSASKAAADLALGSLVRRGLRCIRLRPFNHIGPGQSEHFVVPAFAMQIAKIEAGLAPPVIRVGNLETERDFLDVRDVTDAYALAIAKAGSIASGTAINVSSGVPRKIAGVLDCLLRQSTDTITVERDEARMRPMDIPRFVGSAERAKALLGWSPRYLFEDTLADVLDHCRQLVSAQPQGHAHNGER